MFNIFSHQGNVSQNNEIELHAHYKGSNLKDNSKCCNNMKLLELSKIAGGSVKWLSLFAR